MTLFVVGDYYSGTGPANVTLELINALPDDTLYQKYKNKLMRLAELYMKIPRADFVVMSGHSKQNLHAIRIADSKGIPTVYIMHGCVEHENAINGVTDESMNEVERATMEGADYILAVSEQFEAFLKEKYPEHADKISHLTNGIGTEMFKNVGRLTKSGDVPDGSEEMPYRLISVGGGMPRKRIVKICEALQLLINRGISLILIVAGDEGKDSDAINAYPFVKNIGLVDGERMRKNMQLSQLFIQNSCFETFGLAPLEALTCGCDVLMSKNVGAISVFKEGTIEPADIIENCEDPEEIAAKIECALLSSNHDRLLSGIDLEYNSWDAVAGRLMAFCEKNG